MKRGLSIISFSFVLLFSALKGQELERESASATNGSVEESAGTRNTALSQFGIILKTAGVQQFSDDAFVVAKGVVSARWTSSCRSSAKTTDGEQECMISTFDEYSDQVALEFLYSEPSLYSFKRPNVTAVGGRARPLVRDFSNDVDEKSGEITILHRCTPVSQGEIVTSHVTMFFQIAEEKWISLSWDKLCGFGEHEKLDYGWFSGSTDGDLHRPVSMKRSSELTEERSVTFGPRTLSTRVYLGLLSGGSSQHFDPPVIEASAKVKKDAVGVELRGASFGGVVQSGSYTVFDVMYDCVSKGISQVRVSVGVPPFNPVTMRWRKDCGGGTAQQLQVATTAPLWSWRQGLGNVVQNGTATSAYAAVVTGKHVRSGRGGAGRAVSQHVRTAIRRFFVWSSSGAAHDEDDGEDVGEISAHSSDERVATAGIAGGGGVGIAGVVGLGEHGGRVKGVRVVPVWTKCLRRGRIRVRVTMTVRDRVPVEWWFEDQCTRQRVRRRPMAVVTAGAVMYLTLAMFAVVMAGWIFRGVHGSNPRKNSNAVRTTRAWRHV